MVVFQEPILLKNKCMFLIALKFVLHAGAAELVACKKEKHAPESIWQIAHWKKAEKNTTIAQL